MVVSNESVSASMCPGATLNYSSANTASVCTPFIQGPPGSGVSRTVGQDAIGAIPNITAVGNYTITCGSASKTDSIVNGPSCCGTKSQVGLTVWTGTTCVAPAVNCSATTKSWGAACSGSTANTSSGSNDTVINTNASYTGQAIYSCNNGNWTGPSSQSCTLKTCANNLNINTYPSCTCPAGQHQKTPTSTICEVYSCTGTTPTNATLCTGDSTGLTSFPSRTLVSSCTATKCEYTCNV